MSARSLSRATMVVALGMMLGRLSGLLRDLALAAKLGLSRDADLTILVITIPDLLTGLLVGGAISGVLVPEYHRLIRDESPQRGSQLIFNTLLTVALVSAVLALLLGLFGGLLVQALAPGFRGIEAERALRLVRITLVAFPFCPLAAVTTAALQAKGKVAIPAFGTLIFNASVILAIILFLQAGHLVVIAGAVIVGTAARLLTQVVGCQRAGFFRDVGRGIASLASVNGKLVLRYVHTLTAIGLTVLIPVISRRFASEFEGGIAGFTYAYKLVELPMGFFSAVVMMVYFPRVSELYNGGRPRDAEVLVRRLAKWVLVGTLPLIVCLIGTARAVVSLLFQRGSIDADSVDRIATLAQLAFAALPALFLVQLLMAVFQARRKTSLPFAISIGVGVTHYVLSAFVAERWREPGLMIAVVAVSWLYCATLAAGLFYRHGVSLWAGLKPVATGLVVLLGIGGIATCLLADARVANPFLQAGIGLLISTVCLGLNVVVMGQQSWQEVVTFGRLPLVRPAPRHNTHERTGK